MPNDSTFFALLVEAQYAVQAIHLHSLSQYAFDWRGIYRVEQSQNVNWLLRACRQEGAEIWLLKPAATLLFLEQQSYPAPRLIRTLSDELVGTAHGWWTLMVTFIEGIPVDYSLESLRLLASTVGRLHTLRLELAASTTPSIQASWKHPQQAVPACLQQLAQVREHVPPELQTFYDQVWATLERFQRATDLPETIIHGDCWPGNAVQTADGEIVLIDWDGSGFGPPILDLGNLLLTCHFNQPHYPHISPDASLISAIVEGYCQQRHLTSSELEILVDAVRFDSAFHFARNLQSFLQGNWHDHVGLQKIQIRYAAAEEVALMARRYLEQLL